jgi:O-succinylbenzoic acid--CoA ligase
MNDQSPAVFWQGRMFSWGALGNYVHSTARRLKEIGIGEGTRVLVEAVPSLGTVIVFLSLWRVGAVVCPFDSRLTAGMLRDVRDQVEPGFVLTSGHDRDRFKPLRSFMIDDLVCTEPVERFFSGAFEPLAQIFQALDQDRAATIILTTGSMGFPKAVVHSLKAHWANARGAATLIPFGEGDRWLMALPLHRISGLAVIFRAVYGGGAIVFPGVDETIVTTVRRLVPTHASIVPTQFGRWLDEFAANDWHSFKAILVGGSPVPQVLIDQGIRRGLPLYLTYGMTETASQVATSPASEALRAGVRVLPEREVRFIDGEICVRGAILLMRYMGSNEGVDADGWFHTGDCGRAVEVGPNGAVQSFTVHGRRDRMFISGGDNVHPEIIERALLSLPVVERARVEPVEHAEFGKAGKAYIRLKAGAAADAATIRAALKMVLLPFQLPKEIIIDEHYQFPEK